MAELMTPPGPVQDDGAIAAIILYTCAECARRGISLDVLGINEALFAVDRDHYLTTGKVKETCHGKGDETCYYYSPGDDFVPLAENPLQDDDLRSLDRVIDEICTVGAGELVRRCYDTLAWRSFNHGDYLAWGILLVTEFHSRPPEFLLLDRQAM
jgi:hypothetical protein